MQFTIDQKTLADALNGIRGIVPIRTTFPLLSMVMIRTTENEVSLTTTDMNTFVTHTLETDVIEPCDVAVDIRRLIEVVKSIRTKEVSIHYEENWLTVSGGQSQFRLATMDTNDYPDNITMDVSNTSIINNELCEAIGKVMFATHQKEGVGLVGNILIEQENNTISTVATNNSIFCRAQFQWDEPIFPDNIVLSLNAAKEIASLMTEDNVTIELGTDTTVRDCDIMKVSCDNKSVTCRLLNMAFPDYKRVLQVENETVYNVTVNRHLLLENIKNASLFSTDKNATIRLSHEDDEIIITSDDAMGEARVSLPFTGDFGDEDFHVNHRYMVSVINAHEADVVNIGYNHSKTGPRVITDINDENTDNNRLSVLTLIMPLYV